MDSSKPKLVYVVTHTKSARCFLDGQLAFMRRRGFDVYLIASPGEGLQQIEQRERVTTIPIAMAREISPISDLQALWKLHQVLKRLRPQVVNAGTPKAGLLAMIAACWLRIPLRLYSQWGLRLETTKGLKRAILKVAEKMSAFCAHQVLCNSDSLKQTCVALGLSPGHKTEVLGPGSTNGVDCQRFRPAAAQDHRRAQRLRTVGLNPQAPVIGFVGRLTRDKGIRDLYHAFERLLPEFKDLQLLLVGDFETGDALPADVIRQMHEHPQVFVTGYVNDSSAYYPLFDVFAFPSYREGFPNVVLEASACALPVVAYQSTGTVDAVLDGITGLLVPAGAVTSLAAAIRTYLTKPGLRQAHGAAGRRRVIEQFQPEMIWNALFERYRQELSSRGLAGSLATVRPDHHRSHRRAA